MRQIGTMDGEPVFLHSHNSKDIFESTIVVGRRERTTTLNQIYLLYPIAEICLEPKYTKY